MTRAGLTPASTAMARMLVASNPAWPNFRIAASRILARAVRSLAGTEHMFNRLNACSAFGQVGHLPLRSEQPEEYLHRVREGIADHVRAILTLQERGSVAF